MSKYSEKIIELRKLGKTYKEICDELNCANSTVSYHCNLHNLGGQKNKLTDDEKIELQKLYDELGNLKKIAELKNLSYKTVKKHIKNKKEKKSITRTESVIEWRKRVKIKLIAYKGGECEICGYNKSARAMQFHHVNPKEKSFQISGKSLSFDKLKKEVDKCILVCANCHAEIHDGMIKI